MRAVIGEEDVTRNFVFQLALLRSVGTSRHNLQRMSIVLCGVSVPFNYRERELFRHAFLCAG